MVSAFAARQRLVLGQVKVAEKSNEIVAVPKLLDLMAIEGAVVTIDAIGCQRDIAQTILDKKADYILALKGNQGTSLSLPAKSLAVIVRSHWAVESAPQAQERKVRDELTDRAQAA